MIIKPLAPTYELNFKHVSPINRSAIFHQSYPHKEYTYCRTTLVSFTIFPALARIWWHIASKYINPHQVHVIIVDCCGRLKKEYFPSAAIVPFPNLSHGLKIDYFLNNVIKTPYAIFCDDDIFIIHNHFEELGYLYLKQNNAAVYSYFPRRYKKEFERHKYALIGSHCIMINVNMLQKTRLSFAMNYWNAKRSDQRLDTSDYVSIKLQQRRYPIGLSSMRKTRNFIFPFLSSISLIREIIFYRKASKIKDMLHTISEEKILAGLKGLYGNLLVGNLYKFLFKRMPTAHEGAINKNSVDKIYHYINDRPFIQKKTKKELINFQNKLHILVKSITNKKYAPFELFP